MIKIARNTFYSGKIISPAQIDSLAGEWISFLKELETLVREEALWKHYKPKNFEINVKKLIKRSEDYGAFDEAGFLYEMLKTVLLDPEKTPDEGHSYFFPYQHSNFCVITKELSAQQLKHGTTGHFTWPAAVAFVEFLMEEKGRSVGLSGKRVLEIGCGVGFLGISLMSLLNIKSYTFTDHKEELLESIKNNVAINLENQEIFFNRHCRDAPYYKVELLDFCEDDPTTFLECDVLIGCEVVFDPAVVSGLGRFIKAFLNKDSSKSCHIICTVRNEGTFKCFIEELENLQLKNSIIDISSKESVIMICTIVDTS